MSDTIQYEAFDKIDNKLDEIEVLFEDLPLIREDKENLINSIYELYIDLEKAVDRYHEEREYDQETISSSLKRDIQEHVEKYSSVPHLEGDDDNALMEEL